MTQTHVDQPVVAHLVVEVATAVSRRAAEVSEDVLKLILREIPQLNEDKPVIALLASSVDSNVGTCLQIMQHQIDLAAVRAPTSAVEYARRLAQRGTPLTALLRAYRLGHTCFSDWVLRELAEHAGDAETITATAQSAARLVAGYIDQVSEEMVTAYTSERENWLRNCSAARAARIRDLLSGQHVNVSATEATLGYRLRQHHLGVVCWTSDQVIAIDNITRLERAVGQVAAQTACGADPVFLPATSRARGPGCRWGSATGSTRSPATPRPASISRSGLWSRASPASASPISRRWPPRRSPWRAGHCPGW
jgi:hypothetical protein